jgi:hypothetical protein
MDRRYYKNTYLTNDEDGNDVERITADYKDIGKYVVGVTVLGQAGKMRKVASTLNKMVRARGDEPIFKVVKSDGKYMVVRKLIPDDKLEFIDHTLLDWEDIE